MDQIVMNKLSNRLNTLLELCPSSNIYADIGCDHGYITLNLLQCNKAKKVFAIDIHPDSLLKAYILLKDNNLLDKAEFLVSDGFKALSQENRNLIDCAIIAGMGGQEIIKILNIYQPSKLVLQPMKNSFELRQYLQENGYFINKDFIIKDKDKFYDFIYCYKG